jgi:Spy/CpxP family protein refolding chaperone
MKSHSLEAMVQRVRGEYLEMPGLSLTEHQAQRLWHLEPEACRSLFEALVDSGFLRRTPRGGYIRANVG